MNRSLVFILLAILAVYAAWFTMPTRPEAGSGDPLYYIHASRTLRAGQGLRNFPDAPPSTIAISGEPNGVFATWTPGYPIMLAFFDNPIVGAWIINALALALAAIATYGLTRDFEVPAIVAVGITLAWLVSPPALLIFRTVMTEGAFVAISIVWMRAMLRSGEREQLIILSVCSALLFALRYSGAVYVAFGGLAVLLLTKGGFWKRVRSAALYALLPGTVMAWWFTRNWLALGSLTGHRVAGAFDPSWETMMSIEIILGWLPQLFIIIGVSVCVHRLWHFLSSSTRSPLSQAARTPSSTRQVNAS